ncbi:MAG: adenylate/guanylate cyclase domain-containing protein [Thermoleophilaceae bacterium]|nr:adenylate/guanylate cyclase domain-containing protein [Thermoleophilaceae bacterium]
MRRLTLGIAAVLPLVGLVLLLAAPALDIWWQHDPAHFWLVLVAGALNASLAYATGSAARRRGDARVFLVSLTFLSAAGFLGLHALATPGVLLAGPNAGFALATPVGLVLASGFAAASSGPLTGEATAWLMRRARLAQAGLLAVIGAWATVSLMGLPPLDGAELERASGPLLVFAAAGVGLYGVAVLRYARLYRRRQAELLLGLAAAFTLLAEAMVAVAFGRNWHATWWEWHLLMLIAFAVIAYTAHRQWHEERFSDLYLEQTAAGRREISVLFADLEGFTSFSERHDPGEVAEMLNAYFDVVIPPLVERFGGDVDRIIGDALMVTFNRRGDQPDHARLAAEAGLALVEATAAVATERPDWPRFRVGVNTGAAMIGVLGTAGGRTHTAIGDTVNIAARLESEAPVGRVALGPETVARLPGARTESLGAIAVKGKASGVDAYLLVSLNGGSGEPSHGQGR